MQVDCEYGSSVPFETRLNYLRAWSKPNESERNKALFGMLEFTLKHYRHFKVVALKEVMGSLSLSSNCLELEGVPERIRCGVDVLLKIRFNKNVESPTFKLHVLKNVDTKDLQFVYRMSEVSKGILELVLQTKELKNWRGARSIENVIREVDEDINRIKLSGDLRAFAVGSPFRSKEDSQPCQQFLALGQFFSSCRELSEIAHFNCVAKGRLDYVRQYLQFHKSEVQLNNKKIAEEIDKLERGKPTEENINSLLTCSEADLRHLELQALIKTGEDSVRYIRNELKERRCTFDEARPQLEKLYNVIFAAELALKS